LATTQGLTKEMRLFVNNFGSLLIKWLLFFKFWTKAVVA